MPLKINSFSLSNKIVDKKYDPFDVIKHADKQEKSLKMGLKVADIIRTVIVCSLDLLLMIAVLPYIFYQWASKNERSIIILKVIIEIILEAIMWFIFAGVSVFVTAAFIMEELYFSKNDKNRKMLIEDLDNLQISKKKEQFEYCS